MTSFKSDHRFARMGAIWTVIGAIVGIIAIVVPLILNNASDGDRSDPQTAPSSTGSLIAAPPAAPVEPIPSTNPNSRTTTAAARATYIEDLKYTQDSDPYDNRDIAQINGQSYDHAQAAQFCFGDKDRKWTYILGRQYTRFAGVIGLSDDSVAAAEIRFEVFTDGHPAFSKDLKVGQAEAIDLPVTDVLHIQLVTTLLTHEGACGAASGEWANIRAEA